MLAQQGAASPHEQAEEYAQEEDSSRSRDAVQIAAAFVSKFLERRYVPMRTTPADTVPLHTSGAPANEDGCASSLGDDEVELCSSAIQPVVSAFQALWRRLVENAAAVATETERPSDEERHVRGSRRTALAQVAVESALQGYLEEQAMALVGLQRIEPWLRACFVDQDPR